MAVKTISILGSTGSVGTQTLDLILAEPARYHVRALVAGRNVALLAEQARACRPDIAVVHDLALLPALEEALAGTGIAVAAGADAVREAAALPADWTMAAIIGMAGLHPTLAAIRRGGAIAFANKEVLVSAGDIMMDAVADAGACLLPVDSEHNAIFQCWEPQNLRQVERIILTASGGPFRETPREAMAGITPEAALKHPVWSMGAKITIDSATMMNKALEVIEAARLFRLPSEQVEVLVHPQSVVHGIVCYADGSMLAQLGAPDMHIPIAHALGWPERLTTTAKRLDLAALARMDFLAPDPERFPALRLAREVLAAGGGAPAIMNAANEVAVAAFLARRIGFLDILGTVEAVLDAMGTLPAPDLDAIIAIDAAARQAADALILSRAA
ncbi:1-deoxy-D-xylulose-5-phosphate reductoisomerase [Acidisoma sp. 7E03]